MDCSASGGPCQSTVMGVVLWCLDSQNKSIWLVVFARGIDGNSDNGTLRQSDFGTSVLFYGNFCGGLVDKGKNNHQSLIIGSDKLLKLNL